MHKSKEKKNAERAWLDKDDQSELKRIPPVTRGPHYQSQQNHNQHLDGAVPPPGDVAMGSAGRVDEALL